MSYCIYDNPDTMTRECWSDVQIVQKISCRMIEFKRLPNSGPPKLDPWESGRIIGDKRAMLQSGGL